MTRLALGAKCVNPRRPSLASESLASSVASAATPTPPLETLKKLRRVIPSSPPRPDSTADSPPKCTPPAPVHPNSNQPAPRLDSGTPLHHSSYLRNNPDDIADYHAEPAPLQRTACARSRDGIRSATAHPAPRRLPSASAVRRTATLRESSRHSSDLAPAVACWFDSRERRSFPASPNRNSPSSAVRSSASKTCRDSADAGRRPCSARIPRSA